MKAALTASVRNASARHTALPRHLWQVRPNFASSIQQPAINNCSARVPCCSGYAFSTSSTSRYAEETSQSNNETEKEKGKSKSSGKGRESSSSDTGTAGRSPFAVFVQTLREELQKSRELQDNVKQLQGQAGAAMDSEAAKRARALYEKARLKASIENNPKLKAAAEALQKGGGVIGDAVAEAVRSVEESNLYRGGRDAVYKAGQAVYDASEPIRQTETYKVVSAAVSETLEDVAENTRYGGFLEKDARRRRREARLAKLGKDGMAKRPVRVPENAEAGENVVLHATASTSESATTTSFRDRLPKPVASWLASAGETYRESDNAFISFSRGITGGLHRFFVEENETARVVRWMKTLDPDFQMESFLRELREYIVPEIVDALVNADIKTLKQWMSEATYNVSTATIQPYIQKGYVSDSRVLDIKGVDVQAVKVLENDVNVFIISFRTQEVVTFRDPKTGEVVVGDEGRVEQCGYVAVMTRIEEELENEETGGWKVIDMGRRSQTAFL